MFPVWSFIESLIYPSEIHHSFSSPSNSPLALSPFSLLANTNFHCSRKSSARTESRVYIQKLGFETKMITYLKVFVFGLFPPALILLALLLAPLPSTFGKSLIQLCDAILFHQPHPNVPLSIFWLVFCICTVTFVANFDELLKTQHEYHRGHHHHHQESFEDRDRLRIQLLADERNCWIAAACWGLWVCLHRYRSLLKRCYKLEDENALMSGRVNPEISKKGQ